MKDIVFVTGNEHKLKEFEHILGKTLISEPLDLPEIQSFDLEKVASYKAEEAYKILQKPVMVEDTGFYVEVLNGFPGPFVKYMEQTMGDAKMGIMFEGSSAKARTCIAYFDGRQVHTFVGETEGKIVPSRGPTGFGFASIYEVGGKTHAEMSKEEKSKKSQRSRAIEKFKKFLESK